MSTRARLTAAYAILLLATFIVFGITLAAARVNRASTFDDAALAHARSIRASIHQFQSDLSGCEMENELHALRTGVVARKGCRLVDVDTSNGVSRVLPTKDLQKALDSLPGYFLVFTTQNRLLYASRPMQDLSLEDQDAVDRVAANIATRIEDARVRLRHDSLTLYIIADFVSTNEDFIPNISRVVVGEPVA